MDSFADLTVTHEMKERFKNAGPFPHIVIDNFINEEFIKKVEKELRQMPEEIWIKNRDPTSLSLIQQQKKTSIQNCTVLGPYSQTMVSYFSSPQIIRFFEEITEIKELQSDPELLGGGVHRTDKEGKLSIHADFNIHPNSMKHRRLNALLYLNPTYDNSHQGELELWNKSMTNCEKKIEPIFNRLVLFKITDDAYHGHPEPWKSDTYRLSLAFYYYTDDRPAEEKNQFHWATWKYRPNSGW